MRTAKEVFKHYQKINLGEKSELKQSQSSTIQPDPSQAQAAAMPEHVVFGEEGFDVVLREFSAELNLAETYGLYDPIKKKFRLMNSLEVTYGQILAFAGDFFGIPEYPICKGNTDAEKKARFMQAYASLAYRDAAVNEGQALQQAIVDESNRVMLKSEKLDSTHPISETMHANEPRETRIFVDITTEKSGLIGILGTIRDQMGKIPGLCQLNSRYFQLLKTNFDHFAPQARDVYRIGHELALEVAALARKTGEEASKAQSEKEKHKLSFQQAELFVLAITLEAFAGHYSTDAFTSAHMRVPRIELHEAALTSELGDALAHKAHDADYQLWVTSEKHREGWMACGDNYFFEKNNYPDALNRVVEMVTEGLREVIQVYKGANYSSESSHAWQQRMWPKPEKAKLGRNPHRLYKVKEGQLQSLQSDGSYKPLWVNLEGAQESLVQIYNHTFKLK